MATLEGSARLDIVPIDEIARRTSAARTVSTRSFGVIEVVEQVDLTYAGLDAAARQLVIDNRCKYRTAGEAAYAFMTGCIGDPKLARVA